MVAVYTRAIVRKCLVCKQERPHNIGTNKRDPLPACVICMPTLPSVPIGKKRCPTCLAIHDKKGNYYCSTCANARQRAGHNPEKSRIWALGYLYNLTLEDYNKLYALQGGVCAICKNPETVFDKRIGRIRYLAVDHNHETGVVRGLLCTRCNSLLGDIESDLERFNALMEYRNR